ncbi:hypothetical protein Droror1_Dr00010923 [Drosera rotundifolia]
MGCLVILTWTRQKLLQEKESDTMSRELVRNIVYIWRRRMSQRQRKRVNELVARIMHPSPADKFSKKVRYRREESKLHRFLQVKRKKDFVCLERIDRKLVNVLEGLELHNGVFDAYEQKAIVDYIYNLQDMG